VAWGKGLHRDAALDSLRNVLAVVGAATILADFGTIKAWLVLPMLAFAFVIWFLDYERHFRGQTVEEARQRDDRVSILARFFLEEEITALRNVTSRVSPGSTAEQMNDLGRVVAKH
jgi:hypothetical protein